MGWALAALADMHQARVIRLRGSLPSTPKSRAGPLTAEAYHDNRELVVIITDEGSGMVPRTDSPGLGLGLPLITQLAEESKSPTPHPLEPKCV
jgi:hypothetical protein